LATNLVNAFIKVIIYLNKKYIRLGENMYIEIITLVAIVLAIGLGFYKDINTGMISIAFSLLVGYYLGGLSFNTIISYWPLKLFFVTFGVTLLFSVAKENETLNRFSNLIIYWSGGRKALIPIIFYFLSLFLAAIGPGNISTTALLIPIAMTIAYKANISMVMISGIVILGSIAGGLSPLAPNGIVALALAESQGLGNLGNYVFLNGVLMITLFSILMYFILGGKALFNGKRVDVKKPDSFTRDQKITLVGILVLIIWVIGFGVNVGFASFAIVSVLMWFKVADQQTAIRGVPWSTLLLVSGTAVLISVANELGGIDLLTQMLAGMMNENNAIPLIAILSGVMSLFSSAVGVVMPTLIPTVTNLATELGASVTPKSLVAAIAIGSHITTPSPLSTMGALALAGAPAAVNKKKLYRDLFILAFAALAFISLMGWIGLLGIIK